MTSFTLRFDTPAMRFLWKAVLFLAVVCSFTGCETVGEMVTTNLPQSQKGRASIVVSLHQQRAYLYRGNAVVSEARISTGREGYATPAGEFRVIRKDEDHRSSIYGAYVDREDYIVKANVDIRKDSRPAGTHFKGASMPYFVEFLPGFGLHEGERPGYRASHGCVRMSHWKARQFFYASKIGTRVSVRR